MIINESILLLIPTDCSNHRFGKYPELDNHVHHNFDKSLYEPLKKIFTKVIRYEFLKQYADLGIKRVNQDIIDIVKTEHPKYTLWPSINYEIYESTFQEIRKEGTIVIGWFYDDEVRFEDYSKWWTPYIDYFLTCDKEAVKKYEELGTRSLLLLVYSNMDYFKRLNLPKEYDVSFVGSKIADRAYLVNRIKKSNIQIYAFGKGWDKGYISFYEMLKIYNITKINLSFMKSYGNNTRPQMKCKIFDICMCGGFLLCEYISGIEEFYEIDKEIICFNNIEEAVAKIKYYLSHENEREKIVQSGWERAHRDYDMTKKLFEVFQKIEKEVKKPHLVQLSLPEIQEMPKKIRKLHSIYHLNWAGALLMDNCRNLWKDELDIALAYDRSDRKACYLYAVGNVSPLVCSWLIRLYKVLRRFSEGLLKLCYILSSILKVSLDRLIWLPWELRLRLKGYSAYFRIFTHMTLSEKLLLYKFVRRLALSSIIVEIGSYLGASSNFLAAGAIERGSVVYCVDTWYNDVMSERRRDTFNEFMTNTKRFNSVIIPLRGWSKEVAKNFNKKIDLLFIDGDHSYKGAKEDVESWFPWLKNESIVVFHDVGWANGVKKVIAEYIKPLAIREVVLPNMYVAFIDKSRSKVIFLSCEHK